MPDLDLRDMLLAALGDHDHNDHNEHEHLTPIQDHIRQFKMHYAKGTRADESFLDVLDNGASAIHHIPELFKAMGSAFDALTEVFDRLEVVNDEVITGQSECDWVELSNHTFINADNLLRLMGEELRRRERAYSDRLQRIEEAKLAR